MSEAPPATLLAVVDGLWKSFNGRDWDRFFTLTTADYVARTDPQWPGGGEFRGREQLLGFLEQFLEPWEAMRYERTSDARMVNGRLVERGRWEARGRATGIEGVIDFSTVASFDDALMARSDFFIDHEEALAFARSGQRLSDP